MLSFLKRKIFNEIALIISRLKLIPILRKIPANSLVLDCGANKGDITKIFAKQGHRVISFEPDPKAYEILASQTREFENVTLKNCAVGAKNEKGKLFFHKDQKSFDHEAFTVSSSLVAEKSNIDSENFKEVDVIDLFEFIESLGEKVDVLKMDIEGAEVEILEKMLENKAYNNIGLILVETHENKITSQVPRINSIKNKVKEQGLSHIKLNWI